MNTRDAFSHSEQCDQFFSVVSAIPGGVPHVRCRCWCHSAQHLWDTPEPELDYTPPPEYLTSADRAFIDIAKPAVSHDREIELDEPEPDEYMPDSYVDEPVDPATATGGPVPVSRTGYAGWSQTELRAGKCGNCGDSLTDCECVG